MLGIVGVFTCSGGPAGCPLSPSACCFLGEALGIHHETLMGPASTSNPNRRPSTVVGLPRTVPLTSKLQRRRSAPKLTSGRGCLLSWRAPPAPFLVTWGRSLRRRSGPSLFPIRLRLGWPSPTAPGRRRGLFRRGGSCRAGAPATAAWAVLRRGGRCVLEGIRRVFPGLGLFDVDHTCQGYVQDGSQPLAFKASLGHEYAVFLLHRIRDENPLLARSGANHG